MKNIKDRVESRKARMDEASGYGPAKKKANKKPSYEEDFEAIVDRDALEKKLKDLKKAYKKAKGKEEKMKILRDQTRVRAQLAEME